MAQKHLIRQSSTRAYQKGQEACTDGHPFTRPPYKRHEPQWHDWRAGYLNQMQSDMLYKSATEYSWDE